MPNALPLELDDEIFRDAEYLAGKEGISVEELLARIIIRLTSQGD